MKGQTTAKANPIVATKEDKSKNTFNDAMRNYENAVATGQDSTKQLTALAIAVTASVINKLYDPQRKTAAKLDKASSTGTSPVMAKLRRGLFADLATLDKMGECMEVDTIASRLIDEAEQAAKGRADAAKALQVADYAAALANTLNNIAPKAAADTRRKASEAAAKALLAAKIAAHDMKDGRKVARTAISYAINACRKAAIVAHAAGDSCLSYSMSDGADLLNSAIVAILEQTEEHADEGAWLEKPLTVERVRRRVLRPGEVVTFEDRNTTPIQEVYRAVRRSIENSRAAAADPRNGYIYIEDIAATNDSGADEVIYRRYGRYMDLGGNWTSAAAASMPGAPAGLETHGGGLVTGDIETFNTMEQIVTALNLTKRQKDILYRRLKFYSYDEIAAALNIKRQAVQSAIAKIAAKWAALGLATPAAYEDRTAAQDKPRALVQVRIEDSATLATFESVKEAAAVTGVNKGSISAAASGKRTSAGGYVWKFI